MAPSNVASSDGTEQTVVLVVEDEWPVAQSIEQTLKSAGFLVPRVVASGSDAVASAATIRPDVVVMDIHLRGDLDGIAAAERIAAVYPTPIVYVTGNSDNDTLRRASATEVAGYLLKPFQGRQLVTAVTIAASRGRIGALARGRQLEQGLRSIASILDDLGTASRFTRQWHRTMQRAALTRREREVVDLLVGGARVGSVARALGVSPNTVRNHLKAIFRKVGVHSQQHLIEWVHGADRQ